ncbi:biotin transporter BioY [Algicella marina]|uniref:Biotin transporter n=1 Tax=Algicella marina TaxID=2683284 RepID=A0A6P1T0M8_9RHOB|nr:biotin transporter BioY [Algicella marina]QHQ34839.1 biotin transporter BioY [Algicella marina]
MTYAKDMVLQEAFGPSEGAMLWVKRVTLLVAGVIILATTAKITVPVYPSPVPISLATLSVLSLGAAYGPRLGLATILSYLAIGALGFNVFASSTAEFNGLEYIMAGSGGYLIGYAVATLALGLAARAGWDRSVLRMAGAMLIGNVIVYLIGVPWLHGFIATEGLFDQTAYSSHWAQTMAWGVTPYLIGDAIKLGIAALIFPMVWKLVGSART